MHKIINANIKEWAKNYDGEPFDGILCDPPYELGFMGKSPFSGIDGSGRDDSNEVRGHNDNGGSASRYFYTAKASKRERNAGLEGFEEKEVSTLQQRASSFKGKKFGGIRQNHHPTVKPLSLTKYLATLIKPPSGGRLLVPFSGSGSEMIGALQAGWEYVEGVELTEEYIPIAEARIKYWLGKEENKQIGLLDA
jgi:DNA modification methylase